MKKLVTLIVSVAALASTGSSTAAPAPQGAALKARGLDLCIVLPYRNGCMPGPQLTRS
jgi:hypothetical protein